MKNGYSRFAVYSLDLDLARLRKQVSKKATGTSQQESNRNKSARKQPEILINS
jgi:hypothetical protein